MKPFVGMMVRYFPHAQDLGASQPGPLAAVVVQVLSNTKVHLNVFNVIEPTPLIRRDVYLSPPETDAKPVGAGYALWTPEDIMAYRRHQTLEMLLQSRTAR